MMKIGIDARMYGSKQTGIGNYIKHLIDNLAKIDKKNYYVIFLLDKEFDNFNLPAENFKKVKVSAHWYSWREQIILPWQFLKEGLDLIHFPHFNSPILYRDKSVVTIHDITPLFFPGHKMNSWLRRNAFNLAFSQSLKKATKIIAVSQSTKKDVCQYFKVNPDKVRVIYEGIDKEKFIFRKIPLNPSGSIKLTTGLTKGEIRGFKEKYNITKPFIFYTGVWRNHKNLVGLIKAFNLLLKRYNLEYNLVLGGEENPYYPEIRQTWRQLGLEKDVIRPGFIKDEELVYFYQAASLVVIPSFREGFGLVGLEAMANGVPVAASNITSLVEIFGQAARYFNPHDSENMAEVIAEILTHSDLQNKLITKGFEQIKKYSWEKMTQETWEVYQKVLK